MPRQTVIGALQELWSYRVFLKYQALGKIKVRHKGTILGYVWWILDPLIFLGIYYFVFGVIFRRGGPDFVLFLFCALLPWRWFTSSLLEGCLSLRSSGSLLKQIYFPKLIIPLVAILTNTVAFLYGLIVLVAMVIGFRVELGLPLMYFPLILITQITLTTGLSLIAANLDVFMKDTGVILKHVTAIWFYASPGVYSIDMVPDRLRWFFHLNPFTLLFTSYRDVLMYNRTPDLLGMAVLFLLSVLCVVIGVKLIARYQGQYAKIL